MKKTNYSKVMLYQIYPVFGTVKEGMTISQIDDSFNDLPDISSAEFCEVTPIIVEKYSPFLVREIITGLAFPIINIHSVSSKLSPMYYVEKPMQETCAFVISVGDKLISTDISQKDLEKYMDIHPNINEFKQYLQSIMDLKNENTNSTQIGQRRILTKK